MGPNSLMDYKINVMDHDQNSLKICNRIEQKISECITHSKGNYCFMKFLLKLCVSLSVYIWVHHLIMQKMYFLLQIIVEKIESTFDPSSHLILATILRLKKVGHHA